MTTQNTGSDLPYWIVDPSSVSLFNSLDFWFGAIGFIFTLATFFLGWRKLVKVEDAANAASEAVEAVKLRVSRYDATVDLADALYHYREISRHLDPADWRLVVAAMSSVRRSLIRIDKPLSDIDQSAGREVRKSSKQLDKHIRVIELAMSKPVDFPEYHVISSSVRVGEEALERAKRVLEEHIS